MAREITYFFTLASPWAYLGFPRFTEIAARHGASVLYRTFAVGTVFDQTGGLPLPKRHPVRQRYRLLDLQRWRETRRLPLNLKPRFGATDAALADRCVIALVRAEADPAPFVLLGGAARWADEKDLSDPDTLLALLGEAGISDPAAILDAARGDAIVARYAAHGAEALQADVFGAPSYLLAGEVFWGQDRLELLDAALAGGRPAYRAV